MRHQTFEEYVQQRLDEMGAGASSPAVGHTDISGGSPMGCDEKGNPYPLSSVGVPKPFKAIPPEKLPSKKKLRK